jgi:GNAT superfamily N-acetyltransferase
MTSDFAARVRLAHGDAWEVEGRAREAVGGGVGAVRGARLMASGIPTPKWNNADVTEPAPDLEAIAAWYAARDLPWGMRVPVEIDLPVGEVMGPKRCFGLRADGLAQLVEQVQTRGPERIRMRLLGLDDLEAAVAAEATLFGDEAGYARRWIEPVFGHASFVHWVAYEGERPVGVACTVRSDGLAGPAAMLTGLEVMPTWAERGLSESLVLAAAATAFEGGAEFVHAHAMDPAEADLLLRCGFLEVPGFVVRVMRRA